MDVTAAGYNRQAVRVLSGVVRDNKPHIRATAVVGATGLRRIVLDGVKRVTGRRLQLFDDLESARRYLIDAAR